MCAACLSVLQRVSTLMRGQHSCSWSIKQRALVGWHTVCLHRTDSDRFRSKSGWLTVIVTVYQNWNACARGFAPFCGCTHGSSRTSFTDHSGGCYTFRCLVCHEHQCAKKCAMTRFLRERVTPGYAVAPSCSTREFLKTTLVEQKGDASIEASV